MLASSLKDLHTHLFIVHDDQMSVGTERFACQSTGRRLFIMEPAVANTSALTMKELLIKEEFQLPKEGQILTGRVISVGKSQVLVDLDAAGIGIVYPGQFYDSPDRMRQLSPGQEVSALLVELENDEGYRELSLKAAQMTTAWQRIKELNRGAKRLE